MSRERPPLDVMLEEFRATHPIAEVHGGREPWRYHRGTDGDTPVLWLTGVLGSGDLAFAQARELGPEFRVLAPNYPPARTLDEMVSGLASILDAERIESAAVVSGSFGGILAQHLVRRHPGRVSSLVLSHTFAPGASLGSASVLRLAGLLPERVLRAMVRRRLRDTFAVGGAFWLGTFDAAVAGLSKEEILSRARLALEFGDGTDDRAGDLEGWPGRVLILEADDDPQISPSNRRALRELYPGAEVRSFSGTGHSAALLHPALYAEVIRDFLSRDASP